MYSNLETNPTALQKRAPLDLSWETLPIPPLMTSADSHSEQFYAPVEATELPRAELTQETRWRKAIDYKMVTISSHDHFFPFLGLLARGLSPKASQREFLKCCETLTLSTADGIGYGFLTQDKPAHVV